MRRRIDGDGKRTLLQKGDYCVMLAVNRSVTAWNWTTGGTKATLANVFLDAASVSPAGRPRANACVSAAVGGLASERFCPVKACIVLN